MITAHGNSVVIVTHFVVLQCAPVSAGLRSPALTSAHTSSTPGRVTLAAARRPTAARHQVAGDATKLGVDDQVQNEVDGEVGQQEEVGEFGCRLERAVGARSSRPDERDDVGRSDENCEEDNQSD